MIEHDGTGTDKHMILNRAGMQQRPMTDGNVAADSKRARIMRNMKHRIVLNTCFFTDPYRTDIAPDNRVEPDARQCADSYITDNTDAFGYKYRLMNIGRYSLIR